MTSANPSPGFAKNPAKQITIEPYKGTVKVYAGDQQIASSSNVLLLTEPPYPAAYYIPFADIDFSRLEKTDHSTHCPYKGDASYWSIPAAGDAGKNALWGYKQPFDETAEIKDHGAFYPDRVRIVAEAG
ncbi:DUF427 domain-containing protein [Mesorhizobium sp. CGMCC 1.15528]|uniref:DUF427 domain-containing protein n=1 Tax=Mesorhizobium zhangyense TaxID=1776730 RepID=A0A7C9V5M6_9HYPH|nr:DUF427 domain-containing protein [Mesorhizobium zhangyense]NGN40523.1 DUF427 domain-containing protein [Mesorhizobium zhangyense]